MESHSTCVNYWDLLTLTTEISILITFFCLYGSTAAFLCAALYYIRRELQTAVLA